MAYLQCQSIGLFPNIDGLWVIIIQTLPYPNISITSTCYNVPEGKKAIKLRFGECCAAGEEFKLRQQHLTHHNMFLLSTHFYQFIILWL